MAQTSKNALPTAFSLGSGQAEADPYLQDAFYESAHYKAAASKEDRRCFIVARTGAGKSALLHRIERVHSGHVIRITPEDLSLPYITERDIFRVLQSLEVNLDQLFMALWKHVLVVEIIRHRYGVNSEAAKKNFLATLKNKIRSDAGKQAALEYLNEFEGRFWCDADERVREITDKLENQLKAGGHAGVDIPDLLSMGGSAEAMTSLTSEVRTEYARRFQRIVNETQLARLNRMIGVLNEDVLDSENNFTYIVIDDLDRNWVDERLTNDLISCLFSTVLDLQRVQHLKVVIALRVNIFEQLRYSRSTVGQLEKLRNLILPMKWTPHDLTQLLDNRVKVATDRAEVGRISSVKDLLPRTHKKRGSPLKYVFDRTLMRPRDAIMFLNEALTLVAGKQRLSWSDLTNVEAAYSRERLLALRDEWEPNYPGIYRCLEVFRGSSSPLLQADLVRTLDEITLIQADYEFPGILWLTDLTNPIYSAGGGEWSEVYAPLIKLFFRVGFFGIAEGGKPPTYHHDNPALVESSAMTTATRFHIHPAFRTALEISEH